MGQYDEALASYDKAISLEPSDYIPWLNRAVAAHAAGKYETALACINEVLKLNPDHPNAAQVKRSILEAKQAKRYSVWIPDGINDQLSSIRKLLD
jgi:tetratricopeptide (TPR) repeat protein